MVRLQGEREKISVKGKIMLGVLAVLVLLLSRAVWGVYTKSRLAAGGRAGAESRLAEVEKRRDTLLADVERLNSERGIEEEVRRNLSVIREGEKVINLVEPESVATTSATTSWWRKVFKK